MSSSSPDAPTTPQPAPAGGASGPAGALGDHHRGGGRGGGGTTWTGESWASPQRQQGGRARAPGSAEGLHGVAVKLALRYADAIAASLPEFDGLR